MTMIVSIALYASFYVNILQCGNGIKIISLSIAKFAFRWKTKERCHEYSLCRWGMEGRSSANGSTVHRYGVVTSVYMMFTKLTSCQLFFICKNFPGFFLFCFCSPAPFNLWWQLHNLIFCVYDQILICSSNYQRACECFYSVDKHRNGHKANQPKSKLVFQYLIAIDVFFMWKFE